MPAEVTKQVQEEAQNLPDTEQGLIQLDNAPLIVGVGAVALVAIIVAIMRLRKEG